MFEKKRKFQNFLLMFVDAASLVISYLLATALIFRFRGNPYHLTPEDVVSSLWMVFVTYFCVFVFFNMNQYLLQRDKYEEFVYVFKVNIIVAIVLAFVFFAFKQSQFITRGTWALTFFVNILVMYLGHCGAKILLTSRYLSGSKQHMYLVTTTDRVAKVIQQLRESENFKSYIISLAILDKDLRGQECSGFPVVASQENLFTFAKTEVVDEVYLNISYTDPFTPQKYIHDFDEMGITVRLNLNILENQNGFSHQIDMFGDYPIVSFAPRFYDYNKIVMKRIIDIVGAIIGLAFTAIITVFLAPAILIESPGPLFFKQKRVGTNGRYFYIYKFRSMYQDAEARKAALMAQNEMKGLMFKMTDDPRVTKVGKFIRATSLDEFPQFLNVLKGDMSLVGTRPPTVDEFKAYEAHHKRRLSMKPGLTGMWQVSGRSNIEDFEEVVKLDCYYIDNWSLQLDAKILLKTVVVVLKKVGSK